MICQNCNKIYGFNPLELQLRLNPSELKFQSVQTYIPKGRIRETQPIEEEEIPEDILNRYRDNQLYLPALTVGYVYDDRVDGHAKEAIKRWQATTTLLQLRGETSDHPTGQAS